MRKGNMEVRGRKVVVDGREIIQTRLMDKAVPCSECKKNPRQQASSRCADCSQKYRVHKLNEGRLQEKIKSQANQKVV